jgi:glycosyl transferase family 2
VFGGLTVGTPGAGEYDVPAPSGGDPRCLAARRLTPCEDERVRDELVFGRRDLLLHVVVTVMLVAASATFAVYWASSGDGGRYPVVFTLLTVPLLVGLAMYLARWLALPLMRRPLEMPAVGGWRVGVATTFVPGAEPLEMLDETVGALVAMDYPHDTWVLDEGDDSAVRELCARLGAHYFTRRRRPEYQLERGPFERRSKHGNYNAWLDAIAFERYDAIVGFDPDHVPAREFLTRTLGYLRDRSIGYVQAPQVYYNQRASLIARGAAEETYAYYSSVQMVSYSLGYPIVTGCHHVHRTAALRAIGGLPAHEADDLLATIRYRAAGWRGVYVPETLAVGLTPVTWNGYLTQQRRWARSVLDVKFRIYPRVARRLPPVERLVSLLHGLYYLHGLTTALGILVIGFMLVSGDIPRVFSTETVPYVLLLIAALQASDFFRQRFFLNPGERGIHWRAGLLRFAKWPVVLLALKDALRPRRVEYALTAKTRQPPQRSLLVAPHALSIAFLAGAGVFGALVNDVHTGPLWSTAAVLIALPLIAMATSLRREPPPYDAALRNDHRRRDPPSPPPSRRPSEDRRATTARSVGSGARAEEHLQPRRDSV